MGLWRGVVKSKVVLYFHNYLDVARKKFKAFIVNFREFLGFFHFLSFPTFRFSTFSQFENGGQAEEARTQKLQELEGESCGLENPRKRKCYPLFGATAWF